MKRKRAKNLFTDKSKADLYRVYQRFGQAYFGYDGLVLGLRKFSCNDVAGPKIVLR